PPLLDVGGVRRVHEHRAHLLADGPKRARHHLQRDRVDAVVHRRSSTSVPCESTVPCQPGGTTTVVSGSRQTAGPRTRSPGASVPTSAGAVTAGGRRSPTAATRTFTSSSSASGSV